MYEVHCIRYGKRTKATTHIQTRARAEEVAEAYVLDKAETVQVWQGAGNGLRLVTEHVTTPATFDFTASFESITALLPDVALGMVRTVRQHYGG